MNCPHCLNLPAGCVHCHPDQPLRPPTQASIAAFKAERPTGVQKSSLTPADRVALGIFPKPWRGVAAETGTPPKAPAHRSHLPPAARRFNTVLPANFCLQ